MDVTFEGGKSVMITVDSGAEEMCVRMIGDHNFEFKRLING